MKAMAPEDDDESASPVCYLGEGDPAYAGYLSDREIAAELRRLMGRVADGGVHAKLMEIVRALEDRCLKD